MSRSLIRIRLRGRSETATLLGGIVIGMLAVGLLIPLLFGAPLPDVERVAGDDGASSESTLGPDDAATDLDPGDDTSIPSVGESGVPGIGRSAAAGGSGAGTAAAGGTGPGASGSRTGLRSTDVGVSADAVKLGFLLLDVGGVGRAGIGVPGVDPAQQERAFEAYLAEHNEAGGAHGRKLTGVYEPFDTLSTDSMRAACESLTRDHKVFAVLAAGGYAGVVTVCVTEENETPLLSSGSQGTIDEFYARSGGRLYTIFPAASRQMIVFVGELDRMGLLRGKDIGIFGGDRSDPGRRMADRALVPALRRFGHGVTHHSHTPRDPNAAASQITIEVQEMQRKGVEVVLLMNSTLENTQFVQTADAQRYYPKYYATDWQSMYADATSQNMPRSYEGSLVITTTRTGEHRVGLPEPAPERRCREIYERRTGERMTRGDNTYGLTLGHCSMLDILVAGIRGAGTELTRPRLGAAIDTLGFIQPATWGGGAYRTGKPDLADLVRTTRWDAGCRCWLPIDDFRRGAA